MVNLLVSDSVPLLSYKKWSSSQPSHTSSERKWIRIQDAECISSLIPSTPRELCNCSCPAQLGDLKHLPVPWEEHRET